MTGFHFTGTAVPVLPESWFPFHRIPGSLGLEYSAVTRRGLEAQSILLDADIGSVLSGLR